MRYTTSVLIIIALTLNLSTRDAAAQDQYGEVDLVTSCQPPAADALNSATALLHHMMYEQAREGFTEAFSADPNCAMAQWGIAMTHLHPLWHPPSPVEIEKGQEASAQAQEIGAPTEREEAYIEAIHTFFHTDGSFQERLAAWEEANRRLHEAYPDDEDAAAFYALSQLATAPRDDQNFSQQSEAGKLLEGLLEEASAHPGLFHYTIHAYDNPVLADKAVRVARDYDELAPEVPHALHMPSHIFVRQGLWDDVVSWNRRSAEAALQNPVDGSTSLHYPHAMDYLVYAHLQQGKDEKARQDLDELFGHEPYQHNVATAYALAAAPARFALERRDWQEAAALPVGEPSSLDWQAFPMAESITWFTKGLGAARIGDTETVDEALNRLDEMHNALTEAGESYWAVLTDAQRKAVEAWQLYESGKTAESLARMREAADVEDSVDKHPVTPSAVLPARELLGEMFLLTDRPAEALEAFEESLAISRQRLNSLSGAGRAAELAGDGAKAAQYYAEALAILGDDADVDRPRIADARRLAGGQ